MPGIYELLDDTFQVLGYVIANNQSDALRIGDLNGRFAERAECICESTTLKYGEFFGAVSTLTICLNAHLLVATGVK